MYVHFRMIKYVDVNLIISIYEVNRMGATMYEHFRMIEHNMLPSVFYDQIE